MSMVESPSFIAREVTQKDEWLKIVLKQTGIPPKSAHKVLAVWTTISDLDWGGRWEDVHVYVNGEGLRQYGFPPGSFTCKVIHEETEAQLYIGGTSRREAHLKAIETELCKAREMGILRPYIIAEIKSSLAVGLIKDAVVKTFTYFQLLRED